MVNICQELAAHIISKLVGPGITENGTLISFDWVGILVDVVFCILEAHILTGYIHFVAIQNVFALLHSSFG